MSVAPHAGIIDFGTFTPPGLLADGIQGAVPAPLVAEAGYVLSTGGWVPAASQTSSVTFPASAALGGNRAMRLILGKAAYADSASLSHANLVLGISQGAAVLNDPVVIQTGGLMTEPSWAWTPDQPVFCGLAGVLTQTPLASGISIIVGIAVSAIQIFIVVGIPIVLA